MVYSGSGAGTAGDPYIITDADELNEVRDFLAAYWELGNDIDMDVAPYNATTGWVPIGSGAAKFTGFFDGKGYNIASLFINDATLVYASLFGYINGATIRNTTLTSCDVTGDSHSACFVGYAQAPAIVNCSASGTVVIDNTIAGGFVGTASGGGYISKCYSTGTVTGPEYIGGFVGNIGTSHIQYCYSTADVVCATYYGGGFSGFNSPDGYCYSTGDVGGVATYMMGGFQCPPKNNPVYCYWDITTSGLSVSYGGLGRVTALMKTEANYIDWSWGNIWEIVEGVSYPTLLWQPFTIIVPSAASLITTSGAVISGSFYTYDIDPVASKNGFVWGTTSLDNPANTAPASSGYDSYNDDSSTVGTAWTKTLSSLKEKTRYYYRVFTLDTAGVYCYSDEKSFITLGSASSIIFENSNNAYTGLTIPAIQIQFN